MPMFEQYKNENGADFSKRMRKQTKGGGMVKAANRFMKTYEMRKKEKDKSE